ncbi:hypothetical protein FRB90_001622 [Tulasnella sp. 427]|nr:hypothetical protein FRB90_001622 [Tulasnella sp. 427]
MLSSAIFTTLSLAGLALGAPRSNSGYYARANPTGNGIDARIEFWGSPGCPTKIKVQVIKGLVDNSPYFEGPFLYHIHTNAVGKERNCTTALGHLDPLGLTDSLVCDPAFPQYCQEGDLSGKHGKLNGTSSGAIDAFSYSDSYVRWFPEDFSILGRSVVIHSSNKTRLACGDIISTIDGTASSSGEPTYNPSTYVTNYPTSVVPAPPQVVTPFVGETFPDEQTLHNLPFPLGNPAIPIEKSSNVVLTSQTQAVWVEGYQTEANLPVEKPVLPQCFPPPPLSRPTSRHTSTGSFHLTFAS